MKSNHKITQQLSMFVLMLTIHMVANTSLLFENSVQATEPVVKPAYPLIVDAAFVGKYTTIPQPKDTMIIDSRPAKQYQNGHIVLAINIPDRKFDQMTNLLPKNKLTLLIYYCGGLKCPLSHKSAFKAEKLGYTNVRVYAAGYPDWIKHGNIPGVGIDYVNHLINSYEMAILVDARPVKKFRMGSIPTAISLPDRKFELMKGFLPADKSIQMIFFCGGYKCPLSYKSAMKAVAMGYTNVKLFQAGYPLWKDTFGSSSAVALQAVKDSTDKAKISIEKFSRLMREDPDSVYWIDVRDRPEIDADGTFKGGTAYTITVDQLQAAIPELPTDKPLIFFCSTGGRSIDAYEVLKENGSKLEAYYLDANVEFSGQKLPRITAHDCETGACQ